MTRDEINQEFISGQRALIQRNFVGDVKNFIHEKASSIVSKFDNCDDQVFQEVSKPATEMKLRDFFSQTYPDTGPPPDIKETDITKFIIYY